LGIIIALPHLKMNVTIGIPFYNNEKTIHSAINSVIYQTFKDWKLILIDDGSSDNSLRIAKKLAATDERITVISDGKNKGLIARLNQIIDLSDADYIARMDADDIMLPERIQKQLEVFKKNSDLDVVATAAYTIDENDNPIGIRDTEAIDTTDSKNVFRKSLLIHPSILVKSSWFKKNKYDKDYLRAEDYELWCRTFAYTNFHRIEEPLLLYREGNVSIKNYVASMKTLRKIFRVHGIDILTKREIIKAIASTHLKSAIYKVCGFFSMQHVLTANRNNTLSMTQKNEIKAFVNKINKD
jgi:glycosyltransferase involved in cell wall biosynthesis